MSKVSNFQEQTSPNPNRRHEQEDDEKLGREARRLALSGVLPMVLRSAIELGLIDALHEAKSSSADEKDGGGAYLSPSEIVLRLPCAPTSSDAPDMLNRVLRLLASCSVVECRTVRTGEKVECLYRAKPICRFLVKNDDEKGSLGPLLLLINDIVNVSCWNKLNEGMVGGGSAFKRRYGMTSFEYNGVDERMGGLFERAMSNFSRVLMRKILEVYGGFRGVNVLVDVGGGVGATLALITPNYPHTHAINFDLPHVISNAPPLPGVEHVGGDMFVSVPKGDAIILKFILHNWNDEDCLKILRNCWKALPDNGKVVVIGAILVEEDEAKVNGCSDIAALEDVVMLAFLEGGKERTKTEYEALALNSGFAACRLICSAYDCWIMEFHKST